MHGHVFSSIRLMREWGLNKQILFIRDLLLFDHIYNLNSGVSKNNLYRLTMALLNGIIPLHSKRLTAVTVYLPIYIRDNKEANPVFIE